MLTRHGWKLPWGRKVRLVAGFCISDTRRNTLVCMNKRRGEGQWEMSRVPKPGGDAGQWGEILNDYLGVSHADNGTLRANVVDSVQLKAQSVTTEAMRPDSVTEAVLHADVRTKLNEASALLASKQSSSEKGSAGGYASLDSSAKVPDSQLPNRLQNQALDNRYVQGVMGLKGDVAERCILMQLLLVR